MSRIAAIVVLALALAPAAVAKSEVVAHLSKPLATTPSGGVDVAFSLVADDGSTFSASGIYVRARTKDGATLEIWPEERFTGQFAGVLPTRRSELVDLEIRLVGYSSPGGRSDITFPIADDPFPGPPPARTAAVDRKQRSLADAVTFVAVGVSLAVALGAALVGAFRVRRAASAT
jgi:hypothetical protein